MITADFLGKVAGGVALFAFVPYIISILRGKTKPSFASWFIWTVVGFMIASSYYYSGADSTIWMAISYFVGPLIVTILSVKSSDSNLNLLDKTCLFLVGLSVVVWGLSGSPLLALLINIFADFLGAIPTIRKAYKGPASEDRLAWSLYFASSMINLFAVEEWVFSIAVYPIYMFLGVGLTTILVFKSKSRTHTNP